LFCAERIKLLAGQLDETDEIVLPGAGVPEQAESVTKVILPTKALALVTGALGTPAPAQPTFLPVVNVQPPAVTVAGEVTLL